MVAERALLALREALAMSRAYYVTTPIYYANAEPHIGHTYTNVVADTLVRWHRLHGRDVFSVTGTDEHGEKMVEAAAKLGQPPDVFAERISALHQRTFAELGLAASRFVRTTDPGHVRNVQEILQRVYDAGWIELREYEGLYCVGCERFLTERDMLDGKCRDHERAPEPRRETNYFFLMSREFGWLRGHIEAGPGLHPARALPQRGAGDAARRERPRRPLDLAAEVATRVGRRAALRPRSRLLRVVRRADQLPDRRRLPRRPALRRSAGAPWST